MLHGKVCGSSIYWSMILPSQFPRGELFFLFFRSSILRLLTRSMQPRIQREHPKGYSWWQTTGSSCFRPRVARPSQHASVLWSLNKQERKGKTYSVFAFCISFTAHQDNSATSIWKVSEDFAIDITSPILWNPGKFKLCAWCNVGVSDGEWEI